ncbi:hypothetical protein [Methylacidimicrobium tartarophylax]|uniref:Uncharacterized protein n=1 Tax=Methylacidimicrobium tartarophylax TaxID=1041768 RepID=A0A5E6MFP0_9BACT|nr:hypothetical protein [Methylacidimicrobium tartarophylax]VVM07051.1 hypothetical protein MAMT_01528 [Methylacidimicrobium tartarophylax]
MAGMLAIRKARVPLGTAIGLLLVTLLAVFASGAEPVPGPSPAASASSCSAPALGGVSAEAGIRALIGKDLYPGEKIEGLKIVPEPEQSRAAAQWEVHLVDDGKHFHPLFHPPTIILYQVLPGQAHFPMAGSALSPTAASAPEFRTWQKKLALTRSLMRQVVVLRCMLYCRHQMDALDQDNLRSAEQELSTLRTKPVEH